MSIKLISIDVDGTLINRQGDVTPATRSALQRAADAGIHVTLNTGRPLSESQALLKALPMMRYVVLCTGAEVRDLQTGRIIASHGLTNEENRRLYDLLSPLDGMIQIFNEFDGKLYNRAWDLARADRFCPPNLAKMCRETHVAVADLDAFMDGYTGTASKIHLFFPNHEEKLKAAALLKGLPFFVSESMPNDIEVMPLGVDKGMTRGMTSMSLGMPLGVDKGTGLAALAKYLKLTPAEVMTVGDGENDLAMLRYAGLSVAMGNACDAVKKTARVVTESNDEDGLAKAVERVLRGEWA